MNETSIFQHTGDLYLHLIHAPPDDPELQQRLAQVAYVVPLVKDELIASLITGESWRERLLGLYLGMARQTKSFAPAMLQSLKNCRGIAIVPTCAALAMLARQGDFAMTDSFAEMLDRSAFDGEMGWAIDKAMYFAGLRADDLPGRGPNYGQIFENHLALYNSLQT